ncbi:MAG: hypothetical protein ACRDCA_13420 [Serratia sp. (in: enterobacteria)]|uniref:hypothetical protein n=1 Tax=Serratia sp. (in: enterobacteria) TaxID=616 RepID=UPI003F2A7E27
MSELMVFWKKEPVGKILDPQPDNFHLCGKWHPIVSNHLDEFIKDIHETEDSLVYVGSEEKGLTGVVCSVPDEYIDVLIRDSYRNLHDL